MEAYPDLKASANMQQLSEELTSTENRVAFARQGFNDAVMSYNTYRQSFPNIVIANQFGHKMTRSSWSLKTAPKSRRHRTSAFPKSALTRGFLPPTGDCAA